MNRPPKVSVLIPTYNYARFLPEAIDSVLAQDFEDFELLISDDHSQDGSADALQHYALLDPRVRVHIQEHNLGMVDNWNWCLRQARGTYIKFLFGDDCLGDPKAIGTLVKMLDDHPEASLALSARDIIDEDSRVIDRWDHIGAEGLHSGVGVVRRCLFEMRNLIGEPTVVMFRARQTGAGFNPEYRQIVDLEMWVRLLEEGDLVYTRAPLARFRRHGEQQTEVNGRQRIGEKEQLRLCRDHLNTVVPAGSGLTPEERGHFLTIVRYLCRRPSGDPFAPHLDQHLRLFLPLFQFTSLTAEEKELLFQIIYFIRREERRTGRAHELAYAVDAFLPVLGKTGYSFNLLKYRLKRPWRDLTRPWRKRSAAAA